MAVLLKTIVRSFYMDSTKIPIPADVAKKELVLSSAKLPQMLGNSLAQLFIQISDHASLLLDFLLRIIQTKTVICTLCLLMLPLG